MPGFVFEPTREKVSARLSNTVRTRGYSVPLANTVQVVTTRATLVNTVLTAPERSYLTATLTNTVRTLDLTLPDVPEPEPVGGAGETVPGTHVWMVTHTVALSKAKTYSVQAGDSLTQASADISVRGDVNPSGDIYITSTASPKHGGSPITAKYGPFKVVTREVQNLPSGDMTNLRCQDTTALDAAALADELPELVEWIEHLTGTEQAQRERDEAIRERALARLPCADRQAATRKNRRLEIATLLERIRAYAPIPTVVTAPWPYVGVYMYEQAGEVVNPETGAKTDEDGPIEPSYDGTKGKFWDQALLEFLSPFGWEITMRGGVAYIGPRGSLVEAGGSADALGVPVTDLKQTGYTEMRGGNGETVWWSTTPIAPTGSNQLPRWVDVTLKRERTHLEPLPPEEDRDAPPDPNGTDESVETSRDPVTNEPVSVVTRRTTRSGGRVTKEVIILDTHVPLYPPQFALEGEGVAIIWRPGASVTTTEYEYGLPRFPDAETKITKKVEAYISPANQLELTGVSVTTFDWSEETGYLRSKIEDIRSMTGLRPRLEGANDVAFIRYEVIFGTGKLTETWRHEGGPYWRHILGGVRNLERGQYDEATPEYVGAISIPDASDDLNEKTQNPPPQARLDDRCPEDPPEWQQFPAVDDHVVRFYTGGRGDPTTVNLPWFDEVPPGLVGQFLSRQQPRNVRTFVAPVPLPVLDVAQRKLRVSGKPGSVQSEVEIEEVRES